MWVSRRQAQNAADAGALAGAVALAFDDFDNADDGRRPNRRRSSWRPRQRVRRGSERRGQHRRDVLSGGRSLTVRRRPAFGSTCIANTARGNPLPMLFGQLVGLSNRECGRPHSAQAMRGERDVTVSSRGYRRPLGRPARRKCARSTKTGRWRDEFEHALHQGAEQGGAAPVPRLRQGAQCD